LGPSNIVQVEQSSTPSDLSKEIKAHFCSTVGAEHVKYYSLKDIEAIKMPQKSVVISLLEVEKPLLPVMTPNEMDLLKRVMEKSTDLVWLIGATYMDRSSPDLTLASSLSRALMLEQPSLRFVISDVEAPTDMSRPNRNDIRSNIEKALFADDVPDDKEFCVQKWSFTYQSLCTRRRSK
jgi:hypothetical protein